MDRPALAGGALVAQEQAMTPLPPPDTPPARHTALLVGSVSEPEVELSFGYGDLHPETGEPLRLWVKSLPDRRWDQARKLWTVSVGGLEPGTLRRAGFDVAHPAGTPAQRSEMTTAKASPCFPSSLSSPTSPSRFVVPDWFGLALDPYQRTGAERVAAGRFLLADAMGLGKTRTALAVAAGLSSRRTLILCPPVVVTHWQRETAMSGLVEHAGAEADPCTHPDAATDAADLAQAGAEERKIPAPAGANLAPPTTRSPASVDATSMHKIIQEASDTPSGRLVVFLSGRKSPGLPDAGVVVVPDTLVAARPALLADLAAWAPEVTIYDEAHRAKTWGSKRSRAARSLAAATSGPVIAATGTPMFANPLELIPLLDMTGHLGPVFGGRAAFTARYLRMNRYRAFVPVKAQLPELRVKLEQHVWVRRNKANVLTDLPPKSRRALYVDVDRTAFDAAHAQVSDVIDNWLAEFHQGQGCVPTRSEMLEWCFGQLGLVSSLRRAAGLCKIGPAVSYITDWVTSNTAEDPESGLARCTRPLVVWTHHRLVTEAMAKAVPEALVSAGLGRAAVIAGGTPQVERTAIVDAFQAGEIPVLVGSISAAGIGITLTRSSDVLFVETSYTPAEISQAEDRCHRRGQSNHVIVTTMLSPDTLDEQIQAVLDRKAEVLDAVMAGGDHHVAVAGEEGSTAARLLGDIVAGRLARGTWKRHGRRAA